MRTNLIAGAVGAMVLLSLAGCGGMPEPSAESEDTLTMAIPSDVFDAVPIAIGVEEGVFADAGLDIELEVIHTGTDATKALIGEKVDLAVGGGAAVMQAVGAGADVTLVAPIVQTSPYLLAAREELTGMKDLKGKSIAVSELGSSSDLAARQALAGNGIDVSDVDIRSLGGNSERMAAVAAGAADAVLLSSERRRTAEELGLIVIADFTEQQIKTVNIAVAARANDVGEDPELAEKIRDGVQQALAFVVDPANEERVIAETADYLETDIDDSAVQDTYDYFVNNQENPLVFPAEGKFDTSVVESDLAASSVSNADLAGLTPADVVFASSLAE